MILNNISDPSQHGFTRGLSTETLLIQMVHDWAIKLNKNEDLLCVYFDFSKAFDRVNHLILLDKLSNIGLHINTRNWIKSYLCNRSSKVRINETFSRAFNSPSGVPQGSCLGPLLFKIFVLDLHATLPSGIVHRLFSDDLKVYNANGTYDALLMQTAINNIAEWCINNDMIISVPKCAILSSNCQHSHLYLNGALIPTVNVYKDLGVLVTPSLDFSAHIGSVVSRASRVVSLIFRSFITKNPDFYVHLFNSLVKPLLLYCSTVWSPYKQKDVQSLEAVRNRFIRRVSRRCKVLKDSICLDTVMELHREADLKMYHRLCALGIAESLFDIDFNNLRSGTTIRTVLVASSEKINQLYSFRLPRVIR